MIPMKKSGRRMPSPVRAMLALVLLLVLTCPAQALASSYSLLGEGKLTPVKNQGTYGLGWAFSAISAIESNQLIKYGTTEDYSELHLGYSAFNNAQADPLGGTTGDTIFCLGWTFASVGSTHLHGAVPSQAVTALATWRGLVDDVTAPYSGAATADAGLPLVANPYANVTAHLQNSYSVPLGDRAEVQALIKQMGGATILFYADDSTYNPTTHAWYNGTYSIFNDAVTLVGWDDDYSADNFGGANGTGAKPTSNGAWLVRGSRGSSWGDGGYFWLSYEDASLTQISPLVLSITGSSTPDAYFYDVEPASNYDHNYQYDGGTTTVWYQGPSGGTVANVYKATGTQDVDAVGFFTNATNVGYTVSVYANPMSTNDPSSGTLVASASGTEAYRGYHTVVLDAPARLDMDETFAVAITLTSSDGSNVSFAADQTTGLAEEYVTDTLSQTTQKAGQSFYRVGSTGSSWYDMASSSTTVRIKAFTTDTTSEVLSYHTAMTGVTASDPEGAGSFREIDYPGAYVMLNETSGTSDDQPKVSGNDIGSSTVTYDGTAYTFVGWSTVAPSANASFTGSAIGSTDYLCSTTTQLSAASVVSYLVMPSASQDVYAVWKVVPTISFSANGGVFAEGATTTKTATLGSLCYPSGISTPTRDGYSFIGWYAEAGSGLGTDQGEKATDTVVSSNGQTFYAAWAKTTTGTGTTAPATAGVIMASPVVSSVTFTNYPKPTLNLSVEKCVRSTIGASVTTTAATTFTFSLSGSAVGSDGTTVITCPMPASTAPSVTIASNTVLPTEYNTEPDATASFGSVMFTQPGTYTYVVSEEGMPATSPWAPETINQNLDRTLTVVVIADGTTSALTIQSATWENADATRSKATVSTGGTSVSASTRYSNGYFSSTTLDTSAAANALLTKTVTGTDFAEKTFDFSVTPVDGAPAPTEQTGSATFSAAGSQSVSFGTITFTKVGTYTYQVSESTQSGFGWTCDNGTKTATVEVSASADGILSAKVTSSATIANTYVTPSAVLDSDASPFLQSDVTGTGFGTKKFDFEIESGTVTYSDGTTGTSPAPEESTASLFFDAAGSKTAGFGDLTFTRAGTYTYTVSETTASANGWTCDTSDKRVTITVQGDSTGSLSITGVSMVTIANGYAASATFDTVAKAVVTKTVTGEGFAPATFGFVITPGIATYSDGSTAGISPAASKPTTSLAFSSAGNQVVDFGTITFTKAGTYTYSVQEATDLGGAWSCDTASNMLTLTVTDDHKGSFDVSFSNVTIANSYGFDAAVFDTSRSENTLLVKTVTGDDFDSTSFGFVIEPGQATYSDGTTATSPASSSDSGSATFDAAGSKDVSFGTITFTRPGTYLYTIQEVAPTVEDARWTLDTSPKTVEVDVADDGNGGLAATVETAASISNSFAYQPLTVDTATAGFATKTVTGATSYADKDFDFTITGVAPTGGGPESSIGTDSAVAGTATLMAGGDQSTSVDFGDITFYRPGTYTFNVEETTADGGGWTCDHETHSVTVDVSGNADGALSAVVTTPATITNSYSTTSVSITPSVGTTISVANGTPTFPASFTHVIAAQTAGAPMPAQATATTTFDSAGSTPDPVSLGTITFTQAGTYQYTISEQQLPAGWSNLSGATTMTVVVTDVNGVLQAAVIAGGITITPTSSTSYTPQSTSELLVTTFVNEYSAGAVTVDASRFAVEKTVTGDTTAAAKTFWFELKAASTTAVGLDATTMPLPEGATSSAMWLSVDAPAGTTSGTVVTDATDTFGSTTYTTPGTYTYEVKEVASDGSDAAPADGSGWTYDTSSHTVVVTVSDDGAGVLTARTTVDSSGTTGIAFTNALSYTPATLDTANSVAQVQVVSDTSVPSATFQLTIAGADGTPDPVRPDGSAIPSVTVSVTATGTYDVDFGEMSFTEPGTYVYRISQTDGGVGWTLENSPLTVTVKVQSDENGVLSAAVVGAQGTIRDRYATSVTLDTALDALLTKTVSGEGFSPASFEFSITPTDGAPAATGTSGSASFDAAGSKTVGFGTIEFTKAGVYSYQVSETTALESGWTCGGATQTATVTVTDAGQGVLAAKVTTPATIENGFAKEVVPAPTPTPTSPSTSTSSVTVRTTTTRVSTLPNTGDSISAGMMVLLALSGAAALLVARRRSEKE